MRRTLNLVGGTMFITWIVGYLGYNGGGSTHILLVSAIVVFLIKAFLCLPTRGNNYGD